MSLKPLQKELVKQMIRCGVTEHGPAILTGLSHSEEAESTMLNFVTGYEQENSALPTEAEIVEALSAILEIYPRTSEKA